MAKTFSMAELDHGGASQAVRAADHGPVLVSRQNRPAAWIVSAEQLARVAAAMGSERAATYQTVLHLLAVELYHDGSLTLGQGAKLAGLTLDDFIELCERLQVPILWEPPEGVAADADALASIARDSGPLAGQ